MSFFAVNPVWVIRTEHVDRTRELWPKSGHPVVMTAANSSVVRAGGTLARFVSEVGGCGTGWCAARGGWGQVDLEIPRRTVRMKRNGGNSLSWTRAFARIHAHYCNALSEVG